MNGRSGQNDKGRAPVKGARAAFIFLAVSAALSFVTICEAGLPFSGGSASLRRNVLTSGGQVSEGGNFTLNAALSEPAVSTCAGGAFMFSPGYMPLAAQPGSVTTIVAVTQSTGAVNLAWVAPGLDGFVGGVTDGYYRIDYSSDPAHAFDPSVFATEFSTSVTPGAAQSHTLTGLEPNTTYYARVYLADARKAVAETSAQGTRSTLANLPASPSLSGVYNSSVTFSWLLPPGAAEGFRLDASSTAFGALAAGGLLRSSVTAQGLAMTLTVTGLAPHTVYYFKLGSINWEGAINYDTLIATRTTGYPMPIFGLASVRDVRARNVRFNWTMPDQVLDGVLVQVSTLPITAAPADGSAYAPGEAFPDGSVALSGAAATEQLQTAMDLDTTYYYRFSTRDDTLTYSLFVSTECLLDLPPMSPAGLHAALNADRSSITVTWDRVVSNDDGSLFRYAAEPFEVARYDIYRSTGIILPTWTLAGSAPVSASSVTLAVPDPYGDYFYKVEARDGLGHAGVSMAVDTGRNIYAVAPDNITRLIVPKELVPEAVLAEGNAEGKYRFFRASEQPEEEQGKVLKSVNFELVEAPEGRVIPFQLDRPDMRVVMKYDVVNGNVVASGAAKAVREGAPLPSSALASAVKVSDAQYALGSYWHNGSEYVKVFGTVDPSGQTITVRTALPGSYQIRNLARSSGVSFDVKELSNKAITPNGDGLNDYVTFTLDNPRDSAVAGKVFDLSGAFVADMKAGSQMADTLTWDGKAGGRTVPRGVYIYQIKAEEKTFNGTIVVIR